MKKDKPIAVSCALIIHNGKVLAAQRNKRGSNAGKWEFPGGKIEKGESAEQCLAREIEEELSITVTILKRLPPLTHRYEDKTITLYPFICRYPGNAITPNEHEALRWLSPQEDISLDWSAADAKVWKMFLKENRDKQV